MGGIYLPFLNDDNDHADNYVDDYVDDHADDYSDVSVDVDANVSGVAADNGNCEVGDDAADD